MEKAMRSEEAQELIEQDSGFLEKWGLWIMMGILLLIGVGSSFVQYPDVVHVRARLLSLNPPKDIVPSGSGRITQLFVQDGSAVTKGKVIAYLESPADTPGKYEIISPVEGVLYLIRPLRPNQYIRQGIPIAYIVPSDNQLIAELYLPQSNLGKVAVGMPVQLRLDAYPYQEHGQVAGKLDFISNVLSDSGCLATVSLADGLVTSGHQRLPFREGMEADAVIVTGQMSLLRRMLHGIFRR
ncbi:MAG TPA: HlyD family efflux transporter periplasmic adaptor subunit [Puia sp.]|jgi:multidrug resistance efflux pump|nr:HlyD family efflux transporter periplasmic adaptor subunit [Puia sp.]